MATSSPVVETVSRKRVIPPAELAKEKNGRGEGLDFWDFLEKMTPGMWGDDYLLYILREDPKPSLYGGTNTLEKCPGYISMPDGTKQPLNSREDIELAIKQKYGGKAFRLILKKANGERICEGKCVNEAPPRFPDANPAPPYMPLPNAGQAPMQSDANAIASKAIDTVANQPQEMVNIAINSLRASADMITKLAATPAATAAPATPSMDEELNRALRAAMLQKFLAPPPDPVETFIKIKAALGDGGSGNANALVEKILSTAVDKLLNPATVTGRTTLLDLGREFIPVLGTTVRETMHEYRLSREADARIVEMQRGMPSGPQPMPGPMPSAPRPPQVLAAPIDVAPQPAAQSNPAPAAPAPETSLTFPQIAAHIAKIVKNGEYPVEEAVDRVLSFLYDTDGRLVGLLLNPPSLDPRLSPGKEGLMQLFTHEPALQSCMTNPARVSEFLDKFLIAAKEAEEIEARLRAAAPAATAPATTTPPVVA